MEEGRHLHDTAVLWRGQTRRQVVGAMEGVQTRHRKQRYLGEESRLIFGQGSHEYRHNKPKQDNKEDKKQSQQQSIDAIPLSARRA